MKKITMLGMTLAFFATGLYAATIKPEKTTIAVINGEKLTAGDLTTRLWWQNAGTVLSELIDERLLLQEADRLKTTADKKEVQDKFNALAGSIDKEQFAKNLKAVGWTEGDLKDLLTRQIRIRDTVVAVKKVAVTEEEMKEFFNANKEKLDAPEAVKLSQIYVNTQAEANAALESLTVGADFSKLSALKSTDANLRKNNGSLGYVNKGTLLPDIEKEVFALAIGKPSRIFSTGNGFSIFLVEERRKAQAAVYEKIKDELKILILNQAIAKSLPELAGELRQKAKIEVIP
ncbi:MAG: hypothetical protein A2234_10985 [Elusimicrobia bacterium RIFOXYA2_FULL_58_8]|nr:MAG: hypothetical protein A2285_09975 [Elusimicrobia bacterium RIFOXYA12_FULL_57_11]OGS14542.1 MAG: hypothetical protein A2234_10985 [Elusimicrobia bacterium RIFOXYA2_FULL_58_8]